MYRTLNPKIIELAQALPEPLYVVGGYVRNYLLNQTISEDVDLASPLDAQIFKDVLNNFAPEQVFEYKNTGTVAFILSGFKYEYTQFREESYRKGEHKPYSVKFITDIKKDAIRRDFKCNAVYYDIKNKRLVDVLGGVSDILNNRLDTVAEPQEVFSCDGVRLMRLARLMGELDFKPTKSVVIDARTNSKNILDISSERILEELKRILVADRKYRFSNPNAPEKALNLLAECKVLEKIFGFKITADFSKLVSVTPKLRLPCFIILLAKGNEDKIDLIIKRLKIDKRTFLLTKNLALMKKKAKNATKKQTVRRFLGQHYEFLEDFFELEKAFPNSNTNTIKLEFELAKSEKAPFSLSLIKIDAKTLIELGFEKKGIGQELLRLKNACILDPTKNEPKTLIQLAKRHKATLSK